MSKIFCVVPTFKEADQIKRFTDSVFLQDVDSLEVLVCNGNPGDETSALISREKRLCIRELQGNPSLYWSGLTNLGLNYCLKNGSLEDYVIIANADSEFKENCFSNLLKEMARRPSSQIAALALHGSKVLSSGVKVRSWFWALNKHPFRGMDVKDVKQEGVEAVDFLPTRCVMLPLKALHTGGIANEIHLPHYGADWELTNRLRKCGFQPFICRSALIEVDIFNTGIDHEKRKSLSLIQRLKSIFSIKSIENPIYRFRYINLVYPYYSRAFPHIIYFFRSLFSTVKG